MRRTKSWGLRYKKSASDPTLPASVYDLMEPTQGLPAFLSYDLFDLVGFVDAAHANDLRRRRSTTGYAFILSGAAVAYKSRVSTDGL